MITVKHISTVVVALLISFLATAQIQEPAKWSFTSKKVGENLFEIRLTVKVDASWHIYSQTSPEDAALPTSITFAKNPLLTLQGHPKEIGKLISKYEEAFGATVKYFENEVSFVQTVKVKGKVKTNISGTIEYMVCNDELCLPPATVPFTVKL